MEESISRNEKRKLRRNSWNQALAKRQNLDDLGDEAIDSGISLTEFRKIVLENVSNDEPLYSKAPAFVKRNNEEYSVGNAIRGCIDKNIEVLSMRYLKIKETKSLEMSME